MKSAYRRQQDVLFCNAHVSMGSSGMQLGLIERIHRGEGVSQQAITANDVREAGVGVATLVVYLITAIGFLMWFHRVHRNLPALGAEKLQYSPGWAVGSFFVPFLNLFRPYEIMKEVWDNSKSSASDHPRGRLGWWWAMWLISNLLGQAAGRTTMAAETYEMLRIASWLDIAATLASLLAAVLAIRVIQGVTARQENRYADPPAAEVAPAFAGFE